MQKKVGKHTSSMSKAMDKSYDTMEVSNMQKHSAGMEYL